MATSREQLIFDIFANTTRASSDIKNFARSTAAASDDVMGLARRLDELAKKSAEARVGLKGDADAQAKLDKLDFKVEKLAHRVIDVPVSVEGAAKASFEIAALDAELGKLGGKDGQGGSAASATTGLSALVGGGGIAGGGMGALIAAAAALVSPLTTIAFGVAGLGAAAYGIVKPISNAAQATGGLQKNLHTLDPEQQAVARSLLGLGKQYGAFEQALKPEVLDAFNKGIHLAGTLLHGVEPVAAATGRAFNDLISGVDAEFKSKTWQNFFTWMAQQAGPDVRALKGTFVSLLDALPPLIQGLQPVGMALLTIVKDASEVLDVFTKFPNVVTASTLGFGDFNTSTAKAGQSVNYFSKSTSDAIASAEKGNPQLSGMARILGFIGDAAHGAHTWLDLARGDTKALSSDLGGGAAAGHKMTSAMHDLGPQMETVVEYTGRLGKEVRTYTFSSKQEYLQGLDTTKMLDAQAHQLNVLAAGYEKALTPLGNYISAEITERNDLKALNQALQKSHDAIGLKTQAERNSFTAAQQYITDTVHQGNAALAAHQGIDAQIKSIENALPRLEAVRGKTAAYRQELSDLKMILDKLRAERLIQEQVKVSGTGSWNVQGLPGSLSAHIHGGTGTASGWLVSGGSPGKDSVPIMAMPGELVVPTRMVQSGAVDHLRGSIPGFAAGGIVPSYSGSPGGLPPWTANNQHATIEAISTSIAKAMARAFTSALAPAGAGGGHPLSGAGVYSQPQLESLWTSAGGPPGLAHLMAAIADAESGGKVNAYNSSGASGLWQILGQIVPGNIFNPVVNAENAVAKWRTQGLGAWVTYTSGAYKQYYDDGGWLHPGVTMAVNNTGKPERVLPPGGAGAQVALTQHGDVIIQDATNVDLVRQRLSFAMVAAGLS